MREESSEFSFDFWAKLSRDDPAAFERARQLMIDGLIDAAPERVQGRLRGLQWQVDQVRNRSASPLGACLKISNLMWERVMGENGLVDKINHLTKPSTTPALPPTAKVIPLRSPSE